MVWLWLYMAVFYLKEHTSATFDQILTKIPRGFCVFHGQATIKTWLLQILQILINNSQIFFELVAPSSYRKYFPGFVASYAKFCVFTLFTVFTVYLFTDKPISWVSSIAVKFWLLQDSLSCRFGWYKMSLSYCFYEPKILERSN